MKTKNWGWPSAWREVLMAFLFWSGCVFAANAFQNSNPPPNPSVDIQTPAPPFSPDIFPCSNCHDGSGVNHNRRKLEEHTNIIFEHDAEHRWCLDCHDPINRDKLRLASGSKVNFSESYRLCGQCHGPTFRDWKAGVHGKRTGSWNGIKNYLLCVHCHNPHSPAIKPIKPFPAPVAPKGQPFILGGS